MKSEWFYAKSGQKHGPFTAAELRAKAASGEVTPTDLVWKEGMPEWRPARYLKGLFPDSPAKSASSAAAPSQQAASPSPTQHSSSEKKRAESPTGLAIPVMAGLVVTGACLAFSAYGLLVTTYDEKRFLLVLSIAHNIAAIASLFNMARLRLYAFARFAPWLAMTSWLWILAFHANHGIGLLGVVISASIGVWLLLAFWNPTVRPAFDAEPPLTSLIGVPSSKPQSASGPPVPPSPPPDGVAVESSDGVPPRRGIPWIPIFGLVGSSALIPIAPPDTEPAVGILLLVFGIGIAYRFYQRVTESTLDRRYLSNSLPSLPFSSPWTQEDRTSSNKTEILCRFGAVAAGLVMLALTMEMPPLVLPMATVVIMLAGYGVIVRHLLRAQWVAEGDAGAWVRFSEGDTYTQSDGLSAAYKVLPNLKFVDVWLDGKPVNSFRLMHVQRNSLEIQRKDGSITKYSRSMTKSETILVNPLSLLKESDEDRFRRRLSRIQQKWDPVGGNGVSIQFTDDPNGDEAGAYIRFDGFAARYALSAEVPHDTIAVSSDGGKVFIKILSLETDELVLQVDGTAIHYQRGTSVSAAEAKKRSEALRSKLATAAATFGAVGAGLAVLGVATAAANAAASGQGSGGASGLIGDRDKALRTGPSQCPVCNGAGKFRKSEGGDEIVRNCAWCEGKGWK